MVMVIVITTCSSFRTSLSVILINRLVIVTEIDPNLDAQRDLTAGELIASAAPAWVAVLLLEEAVVAGKLDLWQERVE